MNTSPSGKRKIFTLALCGALIASSASQAQTKKPLDEAELNKIFNAAAQCLQNKNYECACPKLLEYTEQRPKALGAKKALADCYEGQGKLASAWSEYMLLEATAAEAGKAVHAKAARRSADALSRRLARLAINVPAAVRSTKGLTITLDGQPTGEAKWNAALPIDVGTHEVVATAPGMKGWTDHVEVAADGVEVSIDVKSLVPDPRARAAAAASSTAAPKPPKRPWQRPFEIAALSVGGAGVVAGAVLGGLTYGKRGVIQQNCGFIPWDPKGCNDAGLTAASDAQTLGLVSSISFGVGGTALLTALILRLSEPKRSTTEPTAPRVGVLSAGQDGAIVGLKGAWQ